MKNSTDNYQVCTEKQLATLFKVTTTKPYEYRFKEPIPVQGRKSYIDAMAISIRISENQAYGSSACLVLLVNEHYRRIQWRLLSDKEKIEIQKALGI